MADIDRIRLAPDSRGDLDDILVRDVSMFHAERMSEGTWWVCCYLEGTDDRITWNVTARGGRLQFALGELPDEPLAASKQEGPDDA